MEARSRLADWRDPAREVRLARALWVVWALVVWNVVFDHVVVVAGRASIHAAGIAAAGSGAYARIEDWMGPAVRSAFLIASAASLAILLPGLLLIGAAAAGYRDRAGAFASRLSTAGKAARSTSPTT
jgi:hypothetical protein